MTLSEERDISRMLVQNYNYIKSQFDFIGPEGKIALQTACALAAVNHKPVTELKQMLRREMPEHIAEKILDTIEKFINPLKLSYISPEDVEDTPETKEFITKFYTSQLRSCRDMEEFLLLLSARLLDQEEPLTIFDTSLMEYEGEKFLFTFLMNESDQSEENRHRAVKRTKNADEMKFYCKRAVFHQQYAEIMKVDLWNPSQKFKNLVVSPSDLLICPAKPSPEKTAYRWLYRDEPRRLSKNSREWLAIAVYLQMLEEDGRMTVMLPSELLEDESCCEERNFFLSQGCIESIILVPRRLGSYAVMTLRTPHSHEPDQKLYFYDASSVRTQIREKPLVTSEELKQIVKAVHSVEYSHPVSDIDQNTCILKFHDASRFTIESVARFMTRGAMILNSQLKADGKISSEETDFLLLRSQDMEDGLIQIQNPPTFLKDMDNMAPYCLLNQDTTLLICKNKSRSDSRFRTAVFESTDEFKGKKFLVNSNVYLVKFDEDKANPYYVQAYLESPEGQEIIGRELSDTSFSSTLNIADLKAVTIPACDMETQNRIAETFRKNLREIRECKSRIRQLQEQNDQLFKSEPSAD